MEQTMGQAANKEVNKVSTLRLSTFKYFYPEKPRLIHVDQPLFAELDRNPDWVAEKKYNGSRLQLHCENGGFQFWDRHGDQLCYEPSVEILQALGDAVPKTYCLFDGELRHNKVPGIKHKIVLYDVFIFKNEILVGKPFRYRRALLESIAEVNGDPLGVIEQFPGNFREIFHANGDPEIEGLVMKNKAGVLNLSRTSAIESKWMYKVRKPSGRYHF